MENNQSWLYVVLVVVVILFWRDHHSLKQQLETTQYELADMEDQLASTTDALDEANSNIDDAKSYSWSSYDDMGDALDNLETVNP